MKITSVFTEMLYRPAEIGVIFLRFLSQFKELWLFELLMQYVSFANVYSLLHARKL